MIYDKRYEDNIVLKRDAFQNLLTQIKNYPIIDIDYVSNENKKDALHDNKIWHAYTDDTPCLKITYGDDRSLKGNIIFAEELQEEIEQKKEELRNKKIELHNAEYISAKVVKAFAQNKEIQEDKELEAQRIKSIWNKIANSKEEFLKAGLSILNFPFSDTYTTIDSLGPIDEFETLKPGTEYNANVTYYYLNDENVYTIYTDGNVDWDNKVSRGEIYVYNGIRYGELSPLTLSKISLYYTDVKLDAFKKVTSGAYDENKIYYYLDDNDEYQRFTYTTSSRWTRLRNNGKIYVSINDEGKLSFTYTNLKLDDRIHLYSELTLLKNDTINQNNTLVNIFSIDEQEFIANFADFIIAYNYLTFLQGLATVGFSQEQIDIIRNLHSTQEWMNLSYTGLDDNNQEVQYSTPINIQGLRAIIQQLIQEDELWKWEENSSPNFNSMKTIFYDGFENIINTIGDPDDGIIARNLERLKADYNSIGNRIHNLEEEITAIEDAIKAMEAEILNQAGANIIYGYKYVKLGNNIKWSDNFDYNVDNDNEENNHTFFIKTMTANDNATQPTAPKEDQKSGTFRIQINGKLYEVPIKGFDKQSDQPINMSTKDNITITARDDTTLQTITLDGNVIVNGTSSLIGVVSVGDSTSGVIEPDTHNISDLGSSSKYWNNGYITNLNTIKINSHGTDNKALPIGSQANADSGYFNNLYINGELIDPHALDEVTNGGTTAQFWRGRNTSIQDSKPGWNNILEGDFISTTSIYAQNTTADSGERQIGVDGVAGKLYLYSQGTAENRGLYAAGENAHSIITIDSFGNSSLDIKSTATIGGKVTINDTNGVTGGVVPTTDVSLYSQGGAYFTKNVYGARVYNAVFNDYAEYRTTINLEPGRVVIDNDDGSLSCSSKRLQPGAQIITDTFGHSMGYTENCQTPLAVAGRVLTYTYQDRNNYHAGMAVCSAPNGTVDIMTREEIKEYPDCIIGIVSEIPNYEFWGTDQVKVNNRIWIKLK